MTVCLCMWEDCNIVWKWDLLSLCELYEPVVDLIKSFKAAEPWISLWRVSGQNLRGCPKNATLCTFSSPSSELATVVNISFEVVPRSPFNRFGTDHGTFVTLILSYSVNLNLLIFFGIIITKCGSSLLNPHATDKNKNNILRPHFVHTFPGF